MNDTSVIASIDHFCF